jgi:hypothetical protein
LAIEVDGSPLNSSGIDALQFVDGYYYSGGGSYLWFGDRKELNTELLWKSFLKGEIVDTVYSSNYWESWGTYLFRALVPVPLESSTVNVVGDGDDKCYNECPKF